MDSNDWLAAGKAELDDVIALRRAIHADPELGLNCRRTADKIKAALAGLPLEIREGPSTSGLVAILRGGADNGRSVLLRGDMDALAMEEATGLAFASRNAGMMHACGHDAHTAMLVGAARALSARQEQLPGTVAFMFQPGEEGHHGARFMIEDGLIDDVLPGRRPDAAFALHIWPTLPNGAVATRTGPLLASADMIEATVTGKGGHAAMPHDSLDPIPVACEIVMAVQAHIARTVPPTDPAILSITRIEAGTAHNVIAGSVHLLGTLRTLSQQRRLTEQTAFRRIVEHVAAAHDMTGEIRIKEGYPVTMNDARAIALVRECAGALDGTGGGWMELAAPVMGAEDFAYVLREIPGAMALLGVAAEGTDPAANPPLHNTRMRIDEAVMAKGVALHVAFAERFLASGFD
ncbi:M20 family metallopeptidase [Sphingosinicella sp. BN140058]|uniref:M20 metallopeptidase family protein n=1 Tax=Sphingosinicella sp. BN140058 TaxID=1892855 RepID=UPI001011182C|nr:M20 family metallopeptidase [Sphingosinicella sp. BN140058]QAY79726.1 amidohydrolase [Sphingosinicella sp. BN140058]